MVRGPPETPAPPNACETALYTPPDTAAIKKERDAAVYRITLFL